MADISDVANALVGLAAAAVYPNGTGQASVTGGAVRAYQGWPIPQSLDADLKAGICHVSVFPRQEERNTSRYPQDWQTKTVNTPTLTASISGQSITIAGTIPPANNPHNIAVLVNGKPYVYAVQGTDTLASIATALSALIAGDVPGTTSAGAVVTVSATGRIASVRIGVTGTSIRELRRQERVFQITIWADTPDRRKAAAEAIDVSLAAINFLNLSDSTTGRLIYKSSPITDDHQKDKLYRRDLFYTVEYATTQSATDTLVTQEVFNISNQPDGATAVVSTVQINM
jgi:hypothetical protein